MMARIVGRPRSSHAPPLVLVCLAMLTLAVPLPAAAQDHAHAHEDDPFTIGYGDHPGNPLVRQDAAACLGQTTGREDATCVVLYGHMYSLVDDVFTNVQRPPPGTQDLSRGLSGAPTVESAEIQSNDFLMFSSPGFVEYDRETFAFPETIHGEKGLLGDVLLVDDITVMGYVYLSADFDEFTPAGIDQTPDGNDPGVGVAPCLTVRMRLATGKLYGGGDTIAQGTATRTIMSEGIQAESGTSRNATSHTMPCGDATEAPLMEPGRVTEFAVDLGLPDADLLKDDRFHAEFEWYQYAPGEPEEENKVAMHAINIHTGHAYPNRIVLPVRNPIAIERMQAVPLGDGLFVRAEVPAPLGSYDFDPTNVTLEVFDPAGSLVASTADGTGAWGETIIRWDTSHKGHFVPATVIVPWQLAKQPLEDGTYTIRLTVLNWQHTGIAVSEVEVDLADNRVVRYLAYGEGEEALPVEVVAGVDAKQTPMASAGVLALVGLAGAMLAARQRPRP